jgi:hypothetical protein
MRKKLFFPILFPKTARRLLIFMLLSFLKEEFSFAAFLCFFFVFLRHFCYGSRNRMTLSYISHMFYTEKRFEGVWKRSLRDPLANLYYVKITCGPVFTGT